MGSVEHLFKAGISLARSKIRRYLADHGPEKRVVHAPTEVDEVHLEEDGEEQDGQKDLPGSGGAVQHGFTSR